MAKTVGKKAWSNFTCTHFLSILDILPFKNFQISNDPSLITTATNNMQKWILFLAMTFLEGRRAKSATGNINQISIIFLVGQLISLSEKVFLGIPKF